MTRALSVCLSVGNSILNSVLLATIHARSHLLTVSHTLLTEQNPENLSCWALNCNQTSTRPETLLPSVSPSTILLYRYIYSTYIHSLFGFPCIRPAVHSNQWTMYETMPLPFSACIHHVARVGHSCSSLFLRRRAIGASLVWVLVEARNRSGDGKLTHTQGL